MTSARMRFLQVWLACAFLVALASIGTALALAGALSSEDRAAAMRLLAATGSLPFLLALIALAATGLLARWLTARYFTSLAGTTDATALCALANPAYRVPRQGPRELEQLVAAINALAERHERAVRGSDERIAEASRALEAERNRLAVLMAELPQGVIVCNAAGMVLLYNERARELVCPPQSGAFLGLGRSLFAILPDAALPEAIARLVARDAAGEIDPAIELTVTAGSATRRIRIAPVVGAGEPASSTAAPSGFVLVIEGERPPSMPAGTAAPTSAMARNAPGGARPVFYDFDLFRRAVPAGELEARALGELAYTVFDTETTGLDPSAGDEIVSIGAVRIVNGRIVPDETFDCLVDPGRPVDPRAARIHGLTDTVLRGQPAIAAVLPRFHAFCADSVLVGHNVAFDLRFLQLKESATGVRFRQPVLDTLLLAAVLDAYVGDDRLEALAHRFGIEALARHTALGDATLTAAIFLKMLPILAARGIRSLSAAHEASRRTRYARIRY